MEYLASSKAQSALSVLPANGKLYLQKSLSLYFFIFI